MNQRPGRRRLYHFVKNLLSFREFMGLEDPFPTGEAEAVADPFRVHAWVNIAITTLMRNIGRASFQVCRQGEPVESGPVFSLFRDVNRDLNRFDLWKITAAWWFLEGEAFWFFGDSYRAGLPSQLFILSPRKMRPLIQNNRVTRWFYATEYGEMPILPDEVIHFRDWNPWNEHRGVTPLLSLAQEINQDYFANRTTTNLMRNNAVPEGILRTDQVLREEEADRLERRWEATYGRAAQARSIAVLGKGTSFEPLSVTPEALKFFDLKRWNLYTILARYGIPPRVAHVQDAKMSFAGKDTAEQHAAFWKYTILPTLRNFEQILETQFFARFGLKERGHFDTSEIPELQESENEKSRRDIAEIGVGLKTVNDVLAERGLDPKPWGDTWYRPKNLLPVETGDAGKAPTPEPGKARKEEYQVLQRHAIAVKALIHKAEADGRDLDEETLQKTLFSFGMATIFQGFEAPRQKGRLLNAKTARELEELADKEDLPAFCKREGSRDIEAWAARVIDLGRVRALRGLGLRRGMRLLKNGEHWKWREVDLNAQHLPGNWGNWGLPRVNWSGFTFPPRGDEA